MKKLSNLTLICLLLILSSWTSPRTNLSAENTADKNLNTTYNHFTTNDFSNSNIESSFASEEEIPTCGSIAGVKIYDQSTDAEVPGIGFITDGMIIDFSLLPPNYYITVETVGNIESVDIAVDGVGNNTTENVVPYTFPNGGENDSNWNGGVGAYTVIASAYKEDNANWLCETYIVSFTISSCDNSEPVPNNLNPEVTAECGDDYPAVSFDNGTVVDYQEYSATRSCEIDLSTHPDYDYRNFWAHSFLPGVQKYFVWEEGNVITLNDGSVNVTGRVENIDDRESGFIIDFYFEPIQDYDTFIAAGGYVETDADAPDRMFANVDFTKPNSIVGFGAFSNSDLSLDPNGPLQHMSMGTRDVYGGYGFGFWIDYLGTIDGIDVGGTANPTGSNHFDMYSKLDVCYEKTASCEGEDFIIREWLVENDCGIPYFYIQHVNVVDTDAPIIDCPPGLSIEWGDPDDPSATGSATAMDDCDPNPAISHTDNIIITGACPVARIIERTWTAIDVCGNFSTCLQVIEVTDLTPPAINCPPGLTIEWGDPEDPSATGSATAMDDCDPNPAISHTDNVIITGTCPVARIIERTWTATDVCGNASTCLQVIEVTDLTPPAINCPPGLTIEWGDPEDPSATGSATATDNCDPNPAISHTDNVIITGACPVARIIERTWTATDVCGNASTCLQVIEVTDLTPPAINCPPALSIEWGDPEDPSATGSATATDNCDPNPAISHTDNVIITGACPVARIIERTWTATDVCGNASTCLQVIEVTDLTPPAINCPLGLSIEWGDPEDPSATGSATATDNCDPNPVISHTDNVIITGTCPVARIIERTWTATDVCGNASTCLQVIEVTDLTPPAINCPLGLSIEWGDPEDPSATGSATATDNCDPNPVISHTDNVIITGTCPVARIIERTWTATDVCGNASTCLQVIEVTDLTPPAINCPPGLTIEWGDPEDPSATGSATATDNCDPNPAISHTDNVIITGACPVARIIERTWTATDVCGNASTCLQVIEVTDLTPPAINCPPGLTIEWGDPEDPSATGSATATDNCDPNPAISHTDNVIITGACPIARIIERTWTATDVCGNASTCLQVIEVTDLTPPVISCPADATIATGDPEDPAALGEATAIDNCDPNPAISHSDNVVNIGACPDDYVIERTWTATDVCGNSSICLQLITVGDSSAPDNDEPAGAFSNSIDNYWGVPGFDTFDITGATASMPACEGGSIAGGDAWFTFVAQSENTGILVQPNSADPNAANVDLVIQVFEADMTPLTGLTDDLCSTDRNCYNNYGAGEIERALPTGLVIGNTYFYRIYDANGTGDECDFIVDTKVKTFVPHEILAGCVDETIINNTHTFTIEVPNNMYNIPPVPVKLVRMVATDGSGNVVSTTAARIVNVVGAFDFEVADFSPMLQTGTFTFHAQHTVTTTINGCIETYWSQLGPGCPITLNLFETPVTTLTEESCDASDLNMVDVISTVPILGATEYVYNFTNVDVPDNSFSVTRPGSNLLLGSAVVVDNEGVLQGLHYGQTYAVTVQALIGSEYTVPGPTCMIFMSGMPPTPGLSGCETSVLESTKIAGVGIAYQFGFYLDGNAPPSTPDFIYYSDSRNLILNSEVFDVLPFPEGFSLTIYVRALDQMMNGMFTVPFFSEWSEVGCPFTMPDIGATAESMGNGDNVDFVVYPNPNAGDQVIITFKDQLDADQNVIVEVYDIFGKKVNGEQYISSGNDINKIVLFDQNLSSGLYLINVTVNDITLTEKLIVQ